MVDETAAADARLAPSPRRLRKTALDKDLGKIGRFEDAAHTVSRSLLAPGLALLFLVIAAMLAKVQIGADPHSAVIIAAAVIGGYMALTIGANDVTNNVGPAVGARALTMTGALVIAAIFETAGALIAGGDVVETISKGIVDPSSAPDSQTFIVVMMSALLSSALWVHLATFLGAPVSTTHAIVGGVLGAAVAAMGVSSVDWSVIGAIAASWVISPALGGLIAALFLAFIKTNVIYQDDKIAAARRWVPLLLALMASSFTTYLAIKGFSHVWKPAAGEVAALAAASFAVSLLLARPWVRRQSEGLENRNQSLRKLFHLPLICSAALLSFAHGANDVANAVGPLAAILHAASDTPTAGVIELPLWVMLIGAAGISLGLMLYGPRLIILVGEQITKMNPMRAFCVALSAALTVIVASGLGLPVSSTHIAVGAVFGVGFFREYYTTHSKRRRRYVKTKKPRRAMHAAQLSALDQQELIRRKLVRRSHAIAIAAAWIVTVPAAAGLAALLYFVMTALRA